jgi:hypothetical protein
MCRREPRLQRTRAQRPSLALRPRKKRLHRQPRLRVRSSFTCQVWCRHGCGGGSRVTSVLSGAHNSARRSMVRELVRLERCCLLALCGKPRVDSAHRYQCPLTRSKRQHSNSTRYWHKCFAVRPKRSRTRRDLDGGGSSLVVAPLSRER